MITIKTTQSLDSMVVNTVMWRGCGSKRVVKSNLLFISSHVLNFRLSSIAVSTTLYSILDYLDPKLSLINGNKTPTLATPLAPLSGRNSSEVMSAMT